jgi:hypothetical protein
MLQRPRKQDPTEKQDGQALVEFAFVIIFLLLVIFGVIDFARLFFAYATMSNGAREGARFGITHPPASAQPGNTICDDAAIETRAEEMMVLIGAEAEIDVFCPGRDDGSEAGCTSPHLCRIQVVITSDFEMWTPVIPSLSLETRATMHYE